MIKDIILDKRCLICGSKDLSVECDIICDECLAAFDYESDNSCPKCGHPMTNGLCPSCQELGTIYFDSYHFLQTYTGFFKSIMPRLKKNGEFMFNRLFTELLIRRGYLSKSIPVTTVPDIPFKTFRRGRSSMYYVLSLLKRQGFTVIPDIYRKKLTLTPQKSKGKLSRINEIRNVYKLPYGNENRYSGEIILIDDVYTTGATVNYGAKLLKDAGFDKVHCVTFFRAVIGSKD